MLKVLIKEKGRTYDVSVPEAPVVRALTFPLRHKEKPAGDTRDTRANVLGGDHVYP